MITGKKIEFQFIHTLFQKYETSDHKDVHYEHILKFGGGSRMFKKDKRQ